jgi:hypothetical protein
LPTFFLKSWVWLEVYSTREFPRNARSHGGG